MYVALHIVVFLINRYLQGTYRYLLRRNYLQDTYQSVALSGPKVSCPTQTADSLDSFV